ncbi:type IV pilus biogenesis/stability protein PilW [Halomonas sp. YLGW01]|uniref:type IV pilus biogenesis/stability protein PilW n=1 Tax=Halomonas sp. YLGW01 TaxID=2773308 RepID=UPI00178588A2|nr:type IV pilus biogenesis/stability protein PilW [Halomonas sp. YLGW01]
MTRRHRLPTGPRRGPLFAALLCVAWLGGCATTAVPQQDNQDEAVEAYTRLGTAYLERNNLPRATRALNRALEVAPNDPEALQAMAMIFQRQDEIALAEEYFRRALDAAPDATRARNNFAAFLYAQGRTRDACKQLALASEDTQYANRAQLFANLGQCRRDLGQTEEAREALERAKVIDPRQPRSYLLLARLEHAQGHQARAWDNIQAHMRLAGITSDNLALAQDIALARGDTERADFYARQLVPSGSADASRGTP